jgi:hypothetical protein
MKRFLPFCVALLCAVFPGCGRVISERDLPFAGDILDNVLAGIAERDYEKFSRDFSVAMKEAIAKEGFPSVLEDLEGKLGTFVGREFLSASKTRSKLGEIVIATFRARYAKDDDARIRLWISDKDGVRRIEGFMAGNAGDFK